METNNLTAKFISFFWNLIFSWLECCFFVPLMVVGIDIRRIFRSFKGIAKNGLTISMILICLGITFLFFFVAIFLLLYVLLAPKIPLIHHTRQLNVSSNEKTFTSSLLFKNEKAVSFLVIKRYRINFATMIISRLKTLIQNSQLLPIPKESN